MLQRALRRVSAGALLVRCVSGTLPEAGLALAPGWHADLPAAKKLVFIRHAEGWHNKDAREIPSYFEDELGLASTSLKYWDAALTPDGETQCAALAIRLQEHAGSLELVAVSPMTRALQTATLAFPNASARPPFVTTSLARERVWLHACDGRRPRSELQRDFAHVDFSEVTSEIDEMFEHKENEPSDRNSTRCAERGWRPGSSQCLSISTCSCMLTSRASAATASPPASSTTPRCRDRAVAEMPPSEADGEGLSSQGESGGGGEGRLPSSRAPRRGTGSSAGPAGGCNSA